MGKKVILDECNTMSYKCMKLDGIGYLRVGRGTERTIVLIGEGNNSINLILLQNCSTTTYIRMRECTHVSAWPGLVLVSANVLISNLIGFTIKSRSII